MFSPRGLLTALLCILISLPTAFATPTPEPVVGVLTRAFNAHLNALPAFVGLSVFEGESISTETEGKLGVRIGSIMLALSGNSSATLHRISGGTHVDMESGWLYFSSPADSSVEVHAIDALLRPAKNQLTQARVRICTQQVLQVSAIRGDLLLTYQDESRIILEGKTYQISLDPEGETRKTAGAAGANPSSMSRSKIAIFVGAGIAGGLAVWGIH
ncbi:MAG TPA: hypothetical protein VGF61_09765, partial [Candidatus Acidoferrum sp.]